MTSEFNSRSSGFKKFLAGVQPHSSPTSSRKLTLPHSSKFYPQSSTASLVMVEKKGWLKLYSGKFLSSWSSRWIVVAGERLFYYTSDDESKPIAGQLFLPGNTIIEHPYNANEPLKFVFEISPAGKSTGTKGSTSNSTYLLCCESDEVRKEWVHCIKQALYGHLGGAIFGCRLNETLRKERKKCPGRKVPELVQICVDFLLQFGLDCEGLFRLAGRNAFVKQLRNSFDNGERPSLESVHADVHSVAALLKGYLRELPEPIIPVKFYEPIMHIVLREMDASPDESIDKLCKCFAKIPVDSYNLLQYLCRFLNRVGKNWEVNKMTAMNLATVFSQSFIQPEDNDPALLMGTADGRTRAVFVMISQVDRLFAEEYNTAGADTLPGRDLLTLPTLVTRQDSNVNGSTSEQLNSLEYYEYTRRVNNPHLPLLTPDIIRDTAAAVATVAAVTPDDHATETRVFKGRSRGSRENNGVFFCDIPVDNSNGVEDEESVQDVTLSANEMSLNGLGGSEEDGVNSVDITELGRDDLLEYVRSLRDELKRERKVVSSLTMRLKDAEMRHAAQIEGFSKRLNEERSATSDAVSHVVEVKTQLESYILKYGPL